MPPMTEDGPGDGVRGVWAYPSVRGLWLSRMTKAFGVDLLTLALSWAATSLPDAAIALTVVNVPGRIAETLSSYLSGWLADRFSPRALMTGSNLLLAVLAMGTGLFLRAHAVLWGLAAAAVLFRAVQPVSQTASRTVLPKLVRDRDLPTINAQLGSVNLVRQVGGTVLAGFLVALGLFHALLAAAVLALGASVFAAFTPGLSLTPVRPDVQHRRRFTDGFALTWQIAALRYTALLASGINLGWSFFLAEYILYARATLHLTAPVVGLLAGFGTCGVLAGITIGPRVMRQHLAWSVVAVPLILAAGMGWMVAFPSPWTFGLGMVILELGESLAGQSLSLVRQRFAPKERMGSVVGALGFVGGVTVPVGFAVAGLLATAFGARLSIGAGALLLIGSMWPAMKLRAALSAGQSAPKARVFGPDANTPAVPSKASALSPGACLLRT